MKKFGGFIVLNERVGLFIALLAAFSLCTFPIAQRSFASSGTEGASFLDIPVGAGPASMGSAYTALANDAYAPTWNPAGLGFVNAPSFAGQHLSYIDSNAYEYGSFVYPFGGTRALGVSAQYWTSGNIPGTDLAGNSQGDFSSHYGSYNLAYGQRLSDRLSLGLSGKWINAQIQDVSANAYAADLGSMYKLWDNLTLAGTLTNLGSPLKFISQADSLPMAFHLGAAYQPTNHWNLVGEGVYEKTGLASAHVGLEWKPMDMLALRAGYRTDTIDGLSALAGFTTGIGLQLWGQEFAYAWLPMGDLGNTNYFSAVLRFGSPAEEQGVIQHQDIKRHRSVEDKPDTQPEYQELMELLNTSEQRAAQAPAGQ